ncbi:MAG: ATP-dependent RecD-like DNA helicase [Lachnospiraceae bacterium]|nr:ATP-dependent RecD-like DNA helicase [Lachnospiraceae bacterium]
METITGYIDHIIFQNEDNQYAVLFLVTSDQEELICVGTFPGIEEGVSVELEGDYVNHPSYGLQFKAVSFKEVFPQDTVSIERYLGSGAIKGIGEAMARRIVKKFGEDTLRIIDEEPERLAEIKGISTRIAQKIAEQVYDKKQLREAFMFLQNYGIGNKLAVKIYEEYKDRMYSVIQKNPYQLAEDVSGVGFKIADDIARKVGISVSSEYRIRCGVLYELMGASQDGNTYLPVDVLIEKAISLLGISKEEIMPQIENLIVEKKLIKKGENIYSSHYYFAELSSARMLLDLDISMDESELQKEIPRINKVIDTVSKEENLVLDELQREAVVECVKRGVTIISGGPGTGKTTTINTIIRFFDEEGLDILLAAPTGRAAKRMQEATGYEAKTIHRLLEVNGGSSDDETRTFFDRNEDNPLEADVIIIDEMSMVDINLFRSLLRAVSIGTRLVLVGDVDQLPSVGPGQVLKDIIDSKAFNVVMLERIYRQSDESDIVTNAHKINRGEEISLDNKSRDFFFLERSDANVIYKHMIQLIKEKLPKYVEASPFDIQVLTPMRKGNLGVEVLNNILQEYLNPPSKDKYEYTYGEKLFREGDKVMQIKNNYQIPWEIVGYHGIRIDEGMGVYNGDTGVIKEIDKQNQIITVMYDENKRVDYPTSSMDELELAYAVTVHKSQGSEYPAVIMPILSGPRMLFNRNLLYTGVTRAKRCVTILGSKSTLIQMIHNERINDRFTGLSERIKEVAGIENMGND